MGTAPDPTPDASAPALDLTSEQRADLQPLCKALWRIAARRARDERTPRQAPECPQSEPEGER
jgi:hypothetical protein